MLTDATIDLDPWPGKLFSTRPPQSPTGESPTGPSPTGASTPAPCLRLLHPGGHREVVPLPVARWHGPVAREELKVLALARSPVLDVGCGPGRHVLAALGAGHDALGIDVSAAAVAATRRRGAPAKRLSVFEDVPRAGAWATALLLDGNIGIGGDPVALLARIFELLRPGGEALVELDPPGVETGRFHASVEHRGQVGPGFAWARVGPHQIARTASLSGFDVVSMWEEAGRWFAQLGRRDQCALP